MRWLILAALAFILSLAAPVAVAMVPSTPPPVIATTSSPAVPDAQVVASRLPLLPKTSIAKPATRAVRHWAKHWLIQAKRNARLLRAYKRHVQLKSELPRVSRSNAVWTKAGKHYRHVAQRFYREYRILHHRAVMRARRLAKLHRSTGENIVRYAERFLGVPYVWGGASPGGFDCSGLVMYVFGHFGIHLPHFAAAQQALGRFVSNPGPGDLVFFGRPAHHVGICIGHGKMIDAPCTGCVVRIESYLQNDFAGARAL